MILLVSDVVFSITANTQIDDIVKNANNYISVNYTYTYKLDFTDNYVFTNCKKCINIKANKELKKTYKSGCIGYNINRKFYSLTELRKHLVKIKPDICPF